MIKGQEYYQGLMERYLENDCSPQEAKELLDHIGRHAADRLLLQQMKSTFDNTLREVTAQQPADWSQHLRQKLSNKIQPPATIIPLYKTWLARVAAAAIIVVTISLTFYQFNNKKAQQSIVPVAKSFKPATSPNVILPGSDKALLTLADGTVIVLDEAKNGNLALQGGTSIDKKNGQLVYDVSRLPANQTAEITYNTIATPKGGQYQVVLPDGSKVWLNAASSLRFPTAFTGNGREVSLTGEGYFEITKNASRPFHVKVNGMDVEVLGTHFNVNAYDNEAVVKTTLLEGAVQLTAGSASKTLVPGQQAIMDNSSRKMDVVSVNTEEAVAWKNGYFHFANEDVTSIMRQFARWYDVDVRYEIKGKPRNFSGDISRNVNLANALKVLELSNIKFRIEGKKIVVLY